MPQMFPMNWVILFLIFILVLLLIYITNFYCTLSLFPSENTKLKNSFFFWKW